MVQQLGRIEYPVAIPTSVLLEACPHRGPGLEGIPIDILKLLGRPQLEYLQHLFQACFHFSYHSHYFKQSSTITLRQPGKVDNSALVAWPHVAFLNTLGKVLENIVASRITALFEWHGLLPHLHIGTCP
jgi:hypothetical protein